MPSATCPASNPAETANPASGVPVPGEHDAEHHRRVLRQMMDAGMVFINALSQAAAAHANSGAPGPGPLPELAVAFDRVTRSVRRTVALAEHLGKPAPAAGTPTACAPTALNRVAARKRILREVEDTIERLPRTETGTETDRDTDAAALRAELVERLDSPDLDDDIDTRPVADIIIDIVRDLGLGNRYNLSYKRRTPADLRTLHERAAQPTRTRPDPDDTTLALGAARHLVQTAPCPPKRSD